MALVEDKRISNVSEYLFQSYQAEDLVRQLDFNLEELFANHLDSLGDVEAEKRWFTDLAEAMKAEGVEKGGHISKHLAIVKELNEIHFHLLRSDRTYRGHFDQAKLHINRYMQAYGGELSNPIQICLDGIFQYKLKRAKQESLTDSDREGMQSFVELCSYLSYRYKAKYED